MPGERGLAEHPPQLKQPGSGSESGGLPGGEGDAQGRLAPAGSIALERFDFAGLQPLQPGVALASGCMGISLAKRISRVGKCAGQGRSFASSWSFYLFVARERTPGYAQAL